MKKINNKVMMNKKAAIELSIGTIVVIVLAMSMLILGLVLVRNIFTGATDNVRELNDKVKDEIRGLFQKEEQRVIIRLTEDTANIKQGDEFGIAFGVKNILSGTTATEKFSYQVELDDPDIRQNCRVSEQEALKWVRLGRGDMNIPPGQIEFDRVVFEVPEDAPLCLTKYRILVKTSDGAVYKNPFFLVKIKSGGLF